MLAKCVTDLFLKLECSSSQLRLERCMSAPASASFYPLSSDLATLIFLIRFSALMCHPNPRASMVSWILKRPLNKEIDSLQQTLFLSVSRNGQHNIFVPAEEYTPPLSLCYLRREQLIARLATAGKRTHCAVASIP